MGNRTSHVFGGVFRRRTQSHDQLLKQALQDRFADFLRLFDPDRAGGLDLDTGVTFRNA